MKRHTEFEEEEEEEENKKQTKKKKKKVIRTHARPRDIRSC